MADHAVSPLPADRSVFATAWLEFIVVVGELVQHREVTNLDTLRSNEDAKVGLTLEVALVFDAAIVLPGRFVQRHTDPGAHTACDLGNVTNVLYYATSMVSLRQQAAPLSWLDASLLDLLVRGINFLLFNARRVGIEASQLLRLLPSKYAVCAAFVISAGHLILLDRGHISIVGPRPWWPRVDDLLMIISIVRIGLAE